MLDYLIVGLGLAGTCFSETLRKNSKSFKVISDTSQQASLVAGGLYNPVILKRFTLAWKADEQLDVALPFYTELERQFNVKLDFKVRILRRFASIEEQNGWFEAADKQGLRRFLSTKIHPNKNSSLDAPFGFGEVLETGRIDTQRLLTVYRKLLLQEEKLVEERFDHQTLKINEDGVDYKAIKAKRVVFAEGFGLKHNPFFDYLPLNGTKGELLTIKAPKLKEMSVIKSSVFIIPLGDDQYRIGATHKWKDKTNKPTEEAKEELLKKLRTFLKCDFEVIDHVAGVRPTVTDRRPLVGRHPEHKNLFVLNGFGSRGVLIAPYASHQLYEAVENNGTVHQEMNSNRFTSKYQEA
ncbi:FAD-dependent oxidoreductase [Allomuricauda sp. d1]|uniref:NAD(P)/FAD-dependent oxidoreductase n=1 Tax=Allomuricauda sp. d1 TaxID=3136725 RepID=UPI0031D30275